MELPSKGRVALVIYDAQGARVATLVDQERSAGAYSTPWNGRDDRGTVASSGIYFAKLTFGDETRTYKLVLVK